MKLSKAEIKKDDDGNWVMILWSPQKGGVNYILDTITLSSDNVAKIFGILGIQKENF